MPLQACSEKDVINRYNIIITDNDHATASRCKYFSLWHFVGYVLVLYIFLCSPGYNPGMNMKFHDGPVVNIPTNLLL